MRINPVRSTDITYIRLASGFAYLVAIMNWQVPAHRISALSIER